MKTVFLDMNASPSKACASDEEKYRLQKLNRRNSRVVTHVVLVPPRVLASNRTFSGLQAGEVACRILRLLRILWMVAGLNAVQ